MHGAVSKIASAYSREDSMAQYVLGESGRNPAGESKYLD